MKFYGSRIEYLISRIDYKIENMADFFGMVFVVILYILVGATCYYNFSIMKKPFIIGEGFTDCKSR